MRNRSVCLACLLSVVFAAVAASQPAEPVSAAPPAAVEAPTSPRVVAVGEKGAAMQPAGLQDRITLVVEPLEPAVTAAGGRCEQLVLFLDGIPIPGSPPESCEPETGEVRFLLDRTPDSDAAWHALLGRPSSFVRKVEASLGPAKGFALPTEVHDFPLVVIPEGAFYPVIVLLAGGLFGLLLLGWRTDLLRNPLAAGVAGKASFNLARCQLAFWFYLVISAYLFIWIITGELDTISGSVLALLGIGSGTALGDAVIDADQPASARAPSKGLLTDVLSDPQGTISLYRFQLLSWTLVLGLIFCVHVYNGLSMPDFDTTLLGLMGISSGTFLGAKFPEQKKAAAAEP